MITNNQSTYFLIYCSKKLRCPLFIRGRFHIFSRGRIAKKICTPLKKFCPWDIADKNGAEYLIITIERLVLTSAPYAPHKSFFHFGHI